jgi:hypothetical protein
VEEGGGDVARPGAVGKGDGLPPDPLADELLGGIELVGADLVHDLEDPEEPGPVELAVRGGE